MGRQFPEPGSYTFLRIPNLTNTQIPWWALSGLTMDVWSQRLWFSTGIPPHPCTGQLHTDGMVLKTSRGLVVNIFSASALINQIGSPLAQLKSLQQHVRVTAMENAIIKDISIVPMALHWQARIPKQCTQYFQINIECIWAAFVRLLYIQVAQTEALTWIWDWVVLSVK